MNIYIYKRSDFHNDYNLIGTNFSFFSHIFLIAGYKHKQINILIKRFSIIEEHELSDGDICLKIDHEIRQSILCPLYISKENWINLKKEQELILNQQPNYILVQQDSHNIITLEQKNDVTKKDLRDIFWSKIYRRVTFLVWSILLLVYIVITHR